MSDEAGLGREELARDEGAGETAAEQVGVGTAPGQPPATGTGPRRPRLNDPPTGRRDDVRATEGADQPAVEGSREATEP